MTFEISGGQLSHYCSYECLFLFVYVVVIYYLTSVNKFSFDSSKHEICSSGKKWCLTKIIMTRMDINLRRDVNVELLF